MEEKRFRLYLCAGMHCTPRGRDALLRVLEDALWASGIGSDVEIRSSSCLNRCAIGPNMTIWPGPVRYYDLTAAKIRQIVTDHLVGGVAVEAFLYRD
ncbi:MAG: (2Fe-2S) ferredoxin domain-containing protein [Roseiflexaceae bacterium]|nr:(2Fe-2S) ferredoxin domain-containing protein [Roseiflexaceae bacterium]